MASTCDVCGKGPKTGMNVSHSHRRTKRTWTPNIQRVHVDPQGRRNAKVNACTSCIRAGKVERAAR